jgi:rhodanese-related sulfurtransferase
MQRVNPQQIVEWNGKLIDVRNYDEFLGARLAQASCVPLDQLTGQAHQWSRDEPLLLICKSGQRSDQAADQLKQLGFENVSVVEGGMDAAGRAGLEIIRDRKMIPLFRQVIIGAGLFVLLGLALATWVHPGFIVLDWFVGTMLIIAGVTGFCPMQSMLKKMPWNRTPEMKGSTCCVVKHQTA